MKAITIWQPWASLIAVGAKQYETRGWPTKHRGQIAIHAATKDARITLRGLGGNTQRLIFGELYSGFGINSGALSRLAYGSVVAVADLKDCYKVMLCVQSGKDEYMAMVEDSQHKRKTLNISRREYMTGNWAAGRFVWRLANVKMLNEPIPAKGRQGLWNWQPEGSEA